VVNIDAAAATAITYRRDPGAAEHVLADVSALAYAAVEHPRVFLMGPDGGRDVIAALASGAREVIAVEMNPVLVALVERCFGEASRRPYADPRLRLVIDDARACLARPPP
jgi:spermidine synthase